MFVHDLSAGTSTPATATGQSRMAGAVFGLAGRDSRAALGPQVIDLSRRTIHEPAVVTAIVTTAENQSTPSAPVDVPLECPFCDTATLPEPLGGAWFHCPVCSRTFEIPDSAPGQDEPVRGWRAAAPGSTDLRGGRPFQRGEP